MNHGTWTNSHLTADQFSKIVSHLPPMISGILQGVGEPTLNPEYIDICRIARESGKFQQISFNTNALTRDIEYYREILKYIDFFQVSVDTFNHLIAEKTRTGTDVVKLFNRINEFHNHNLPFRVQMVASRINFLDITSTLSALNSIGKMSVNILPFQDHRPEYVSASLSREEWDYLRTLITSVQTYLPNVTVHMEPISGEGNLQGICTSPAFAPAVTSEGYLTPCCVDMDPASMGYASLVEHSWEELWETEGVKNYFHKLFEENTDACRTCSKNGRVAHSNEYEIKQESLTSAVSFCLKTGNADEGVAIAHSFIEKTPESPAGYFIGAQLLGILNRPEEAIPLLDKLRASTGPIEVVENLYEKLLTQKM